MNERVFVMVLSEQGREELFRRAKECQNHHHGCDCREAHWLALVNNLESERDKYKTLSDQLKADLLLTQNQLAQIRISMALKEKENMEKDGMQKTMNAFTPPEGVSVSAWCAKTSIQLCHCCDNMECVDNMKNELNTRKAP